MDKIYFDNAATTNLDKEVIDVMIQSFNEVYGNPSSVHQFGRSAKAKVENARKKISKIFNATPSEIVFTSGGSEADNMILSNAVRHLGVRRIITSKIEHHAVIHTIDVLKLEDAIDVCYVNLLEDGSIDLAHLELLLNQVAEKTLVSLMYVNNEIGNILDVSKVSDLCQNSNALFHTDAVQAIGHFNIDFRKIPIDFAAASAHKFHGPKGVGFAFFKKGFGIKPLLNGGSQERGARAGTENVSGIMGLEKAIEVAYRNLDEDTLFVSELKEYFIQQVKSHIPEIKFNGNVLNKEQNSYAILNVQFPIENTMLLFTLDLKGIAVSGGSACQSGSVEGSHVLKAILSEEESLNTSVRFSFSKYNSKFEIDKVIKVLKNILNS